MRDILFRGIWVHGNKEWIEGDLVRDSEGKPHIVDNKYAVYWGGESTFVCEDECEVIPETVGQYTGLTDKNGKKIFEGDIVKHYNNSDDGFDIGALYWDEQFSQWKRTSIGNFHHKSFTYTASRSCDYEVIGNVHDNPELLEVK